MKKNQQLEAEDEQELEIIKAVSQAWLSHSRSSRPMNEFDAHQRNFEGKHSRFKLEAMSKKSSNKNIVPATWDFRKSLWDSYEIVTLSKRLERVSILDNPFTEFTGSSGVHRRPKESKNNLRNLFNQMSSRRFNEPSIPRETDT
ncbi:putative Mediator of RNA polymerase II transcription subunit 13 [Quillaja saponaria]|uniref:Mediator of RNA polymerase II transcription subunit 13 n=1 Tax=Quillaja saponaria TaxID=32244 RepID=A0AAD7KU05_QUISA|nr:putative Mediator of RNA polymerase II transcription subunit 13 [Quillaja saponaria]